MILVILTILFPLYSGSFEIEDLHQRLLFSAKDFEEYQYLDLNYKYLQILKSECESQISKKIFPQSCYLAQSRAEKLGLHFDKSLNQVKSDKNCFEVVQKIYNISILLNLEQKDFVSKVCKEFIRDQVRKLNYIHSH